MTQVRLEIDGQALDVPEGISVAAAIARLSRPFRRSVSGQARAAFCGMGICFECRVTINGIPHCRSCQSLCEPGMEVTSEV